MKDTYEHEKQEEETSGEMVSNTAIPEATESASQNQSNLSKDEVFFKRAKGMPFEEFKKACIEQCRKVGMFE